MSSPWDKSQVSLFLDPGNGVSQTHRAGAYNVRRLSVQVPPGHDVGMSQGQLWFLFRSVAIAPPMDISGSKQQAFLLLPHYSSPPNLVQIRVVGVNDTDRPSDKAYSMSALALAKICRPTFMRLCWHVSETHQGKRHALYPRVTSNKEYVIANIKKHSRPITTIDL